MAIALAEILPSPQSPQSLTKVLIAGWAGRDPAGVQHHIDELAAIGIAPPSQTPLFYEVSRDRLNTSGRIQEVGTDSGGEVELVLWRLNGALYLGLGSDHTDRALESHSVALSKQISDKPVSTRVIAWDDLKSPLDDLTMACDIYQDGGWVSYQKGLLNTLIPPLDLLALAEQRGAITASDNLAMLCGTLPAIGGVRAADRYKMALSDSDGQPLISLDYTVERLPSRA
ncbi:MAG: DUF2848 domain-containing protein [Rhodobacteraceae bacterium]|nr:DUF2848 domain-containing protein [Paracoccaceae bacterium]